jgi:hypothetical protein
MTEISVVIPTDARPALLRRCVEALLAQRCDPSRYEVIVVDDANDPATPAVVGELAAAHALPAVRYVAMARRGGPGAARNAGWRIAAGALIAFTDDDCVPSPWWLQALLGAFTDAVDGVQGRIVMPPPPVPTDDAHTTAGLARTEFPTANCAYRREALAHVGGFDERFTRAWREDADVYFRLLEAGRPLVVAPGAVVAHPIRPAPWGVSLRQARNNFFEPLLAAKHPRRYRERVHTAVPGYAVITALLALALVCAAMGASTTAVLTGGAWLLLTSRFCARRLRGTSRAPAHVADMIVTSALLPPVSLFWRGLGVLRWGVPSLLRRSGAGAVHRDPFAVPVLSPIRRWRIIPNAHAHALRDRPTAGADAVHPHADHVA